jgi:Flp pilus assembly protein TadG
MREAGSTTIEMIAWLPILLLSVAAIVHFGLYFNAKNAVQAAAFEAARQASVSAEPVQTANQVVENFADSILPGWQVGKRLRIQTVAGDDGSPNAKIRVSVTYDVPLFMTGIFRSAESSGSLIASGEAEMKIEEKP